jgi:hypothetical protein
MVLQEWPSHINDPLSINIYQPSEIKIIKKMYQMQWKDRKFPPVVNDFAPLHLHSSIHFHYVVLYLCLLPNTCSLKCVVLQTTLNQGSQLT